MALQQTFALAFLVIAQTSPQAAQRAASLIAPSATDFDRLLEETTMLSENAEAIGAALSRVQNALGERWTVTSSTAKSPAIEEPLAELALEPVLLRDHRDAVQSLRASSERLQRAAEAPTVAPVIFGARAKRVKLLVETTRMMVRTHSEAVAWHDRYVSPRVARLKTPPELATLPGWASRAPLASDDPNPRVAVVGIGGATICPDGFPADGTTVVLRNRVACLGGPECTCSAVPVHPGAVLSP